MNEEYGKFILCSQEVKNNFQQMTNLEQEYIANRIYESLKNAEIKLMMQFMESKDK